MKMCTQAHHTETGKWNEEWVGEREKMLQASEVSVGHGTKNIVTVHGSGLLTTGQEAGTTSVTLPSKSSVASQHSATYWEKQSHRHLWGPFSIVNELCKKWNILTTGGKAIVSFQLIVL